MIRCRYILYTMIICVVTSAASADLTDGLISVWTFDNRTVEDSRGSNDGVLRGDAGFAPDRNRGMALDLNGKDAFAEIPHSDSMDAMADELTAACWFFVRGNAQEFPSFFWKGLGMGWSPAYLFQLSIRNPDTTVMQYGSCTQGGEGWFNYRVDPVDDGTWHHTATVANGEELNGYFDGKEMVLLSSYNGGRRPLALKAPYNVFPDQPIRMGMGQGIGGNPFIDPKLLDNKSYIDGMVDDAVIFSRALSEEEIQELMETDLSDFATVDPHGKLATTWASLKQ